MPVAFPTGTFPVVVNGNSSDPLSGSLVLSVVSGSNTASFKSGDVTPSLTWDTTKGEIGWDYTDGSDFLHHYKKGLYAAGPPQSFSGGKVNKSGGVDGEVEDPWAATAG